MESFKITTELGGQAIIASHQTELNMEEAMRGGVCPVGVMIMAPVLHKHRDGSKFPKTEMVFVQVDEFVRDSVPDTGRGWRKALDHLADLEIYPLQVSE